MYLRMRTVCENHAHSSAHSRRRCLPQANVAPTRLPARPPAMSATPMKRTTRARHAAGPSVPHESPESAACRCDLSRSEVTRKPTGGAQSAVRQLLNSPPTAATITTIRPRSSLHTHKWSRWPESSPQTRRAQVQYRTAHRAVGGSTWTRWPHRS